MNNLCADVGYRSINKKSEQLCGDHVEIVQQGEDNLIMVLADGLGSGVKACILSTLTSKIISTMMANNMTVEDCVNTIAATLPVGLAAVHIRICGTVYNSVIPLLFKKRPYRLYIRDIQLVNIYRADFIFPL